MRERLLFHLRSLPQIVEGWNRPEDADPQPSQFARSLTKVTITVGSFSLVHMISVAFVLRYCVCQFDDTAFMLPYSFEILFHTV